MAGVMRGVRVARRRWLRPAGAAGTAALAALAALVLVGGSAAAATAAAPHWTLVSTPDTSSTARNVLSGVSCPSDSFCEAVGYYFSGAANQTRVLRWNGTKWAKASSPDVSTAEDNVLTAVSCPDTKFCMAVGYYQHGTAQQTLTLRWNGTKWAKVSSPDSSAARDNDLAGVSCTSASLCMAVGHYENSTTGQTLVLKWNGTKWSKMASPDSGTANDNILSGVSCSTTSFCMAAGYNYDIGPTQLTLVLKWNGTKWTTVSSPDQGAQDSGLVGVSCPTTKFCMATGDSYSGDYQTLALKWNGTKWALVSSPNSTYNYLEGVSCPTASFCMTTGQTFNGGVGHVIMLKWNGTKWAKVSSPDVGTAESYLNELSCASATYCLAAGWYGPVSHALTEKW